MIDILFTIPNFITAGSGRAMMNIVERLDPGRFAPAVCVMKRGGPLDREVERLGIPFIEAPFTVPARPYHSLPVRAWRAARPFRAGRFHLWHSFHYLDDYTEPIIARMAGTRAWVYTKKSMNWRRRAWTLRTMMAGQVAAQNSEMMRDFFGGRWFARKARLIPPGVDTGLYHPGVPPRLGLRGRCVVRADSVVVGCVAHLVPVKGVGTLIRAAARVPSAHLLIAGRPTDREYADSLVRLTADLGIAERVSFLDGVDDVPALLAELDVFVLPTESRGEGCPVALMEAMAAGRACVATDVPGSRDLVEDGRCGLLVPAGNADAMAEALKRLADSPGLRRSFEAAARERVEQRFGVERELADYEALYAEVLGD
jgi:glycosyltransferase involved in cell wall biosynthesis